MTNTEKIIALQTRLDAANARVRALETALHRQAVALAREQERYEEALRAITELTANQLISDARDRTKSEELTQLRGDLKIATTECEKVTAYANAQRDRADKAERANCKLVQEMTRARKRAKK